MPVILRSIACYYPDKVLTNDDLSDMVDTNDEWITERTGIKERRIAEEGTECSDMAAIAGQRAIDKAGLTNDDIDCLIVATCAPDQPNPATACITAGKMGLLGIPAFDMNAMCSGFLYALQVANGLTASGLYKNVLVIGAEKLSDIIDWTDRRTCILFGDAAGAAVVSSGDASEGHELIGSYMSSLGSQSHLLGCHGKPSDTTAHYLHMQGAEIFRHAVKNLVAVSEHILEESGFKHEDIDWLVPHQANIRILQAAAKLFELPMEKVVVTLDRFGNTSAASIPVAIAESEAQFKKGDLLLCPAFGGGLTFAATLIRW